MSDTEKPEHETGRGLARILGVDEKSVRKAAARGLIRKVARGAHIGLYHVPTCIAAWQTQRDPDRVIAGLAGAAASGSPKSEQDAGYSAALPDSSLTRARTATAAIDAQHRKLRLDKEKGTLINRDEARRAVRALITTVLERMDGAASQIAVRVSGVSSIPECERIARDVLNAVREEVAGLGRALEANNA